MEIDWDTVAAVATATAAIIALSIWIFDKP
jgi:hypothetical protein